MAKPKAKEAPAPKGKKSGDAGKKRAKEAPAEEPEEVDYATSGPDIAQHKKISNYVFGFTLFTLLAVIGVLVFLSMRGKASGKHATSLGKGR